MAVRTTMVPVIEISDTHRETRIPYWPGRSVIDRRSVDRIVIGVAVIGVAVGVGPV
jgi:hypothetical protein